MTRMFDCRLEPISGLLCICSLGRAEVYRPFAAFCTPATLFVKSFLRSCENVGKVSWTPSKWGAKTDVDICQALRLSQDDDEEHGAARAKVGV